jgi:hypothetical protein
MSDPITQAHVDKLMVRDRPSADGHRDRVPMNPHLAFLLSSIYPGALAPEHRLDLEQSGLTRETVHLQGFRSIPPSMIAPLLGFDLPAIRSACLYPFPAPGGGWMDLVRMKIFPSLVDAKDHTTKYLQPRRSRPRVYFCRCVIDHVLHGDEPLWVVEGEKKSLAVAQLGLPAIGISGIQAWHEAGSRALLADFDGIPLHGRTIELVPDGDVVSNRAVGLGAQRFALALAARGAAPRLVVLPEEVIA